jgi:(p)ppGpp synthase/HD superfamily hydrolase
MQIVPTGFPSFVEGLDLTRRAVDFAMKSHKGQRRESDDADFVLHPLEVASLLYNDGWPDVVIAAAALHDVVESTDADIGAVREQLGDHVADLVQAVTEDEGIDDFEKRKAALRSQVSHSAPEAVAIYAADKVAKARELRARMAFGRASDPAEADELKAKLDHYEKSLKMLEQVMPELPLVRQLRFELEALHVMPPAGAAPLR